LHVSPSALSIQLRQLEDRLGVPVTASSPAGFWDVVRLGGWDARAPGFGRLFGLH
jgi:arylmalonate decarboxylase